MNHRRTPTTTVPHRAVRHQRLASAALALCPLFGDAGFTLDAAHPSRWYLRLPREARLPGFASPEAALGEDVFEHDAFATAGNDADARRWRVLASEAQVLLHNHPHNAARAAAGRVPINALWFWGGGVLPDAIAGAAPTLYSDDPLLHGIARVGRLQAMPLDDFANADGEAPGRHPLCALVCALVCASMAAPCAAMVAMRSFHTARAAAG